MTPTQTPQAPPADLAKIIAKARKELSLFRTYVRRIGLTGWTSRDAGGYYRDAFAAVAAVEDTIGSDATIAVDLGDRLRGLYHEARDGGLLSVDDIARLEREAIALADEWAARLPFDHPARCAARRRAGRAARSAAYATLEPGDVIFVDEPHDLEDRRRGYCPAHFAQVVSWNDGDMGVRGLLGGGPSSGPLPLDSETWFLVGHAGPTYVTRNGRTHLGGGAGPAADLVRRLLSD